MRKSKKGRNFGFRNLNKETLKKIKGGKNPEDFLSNKMPGFTSGYDFNLKKK